MTHRLQCVACARLLAGERTSACCVSMRLVQPFVARREAHERQHRAALLREAMKSRTDALLPSRCAAILIHHADRHDARTTDARHENVMRRGIDCVASGVMRSRVRSALADRTRRRLAFFSFAAFQR